MKSSIGKWSDAFSDGRAVTALALVLGDVSLAVGDAKGEVTTWSPVNADGTRKLQLIHRLEPHSRPIREILASGRNKSILSLSADGVVHLDHMTSERHLLSLSLCEVAPPCGAGGTPAVEKAGGRPAPQVALGPRGDALLALDGDGQLTAWQIEGGCPEISFQTLFGKVFYEGYDRPEYVWQTTGGEDFEPKLSLVPLLFGTLKGTFYAMLLAVAVGAVRGDVRELLHRARTARSDQAGDRSHGQRALGRDRLSGGLVAGPDSRKLAVHVFPQR